MTKAIFFDRDGTLIKDNEYMFKPEQIEIFDGVKDALNELRQMGYSLFILSNQSGVARGYFTLKQAIEFNDQFLEKLGVDKDFFADTCLAIESSEVSDGYRKPSPKFVFESARKFDIDLSKSFVVGDRKSDWQTAINAGARPIAVTTGKPLGDDDFKFLSSINAPILISVAKLPDLLKQ